MFKYENKEPSGTKLRALGVFLVGKESVLGQKQMLNSMCSDSAPLSSPREPHASSLLKKYHSKGDTYGYTLIFSSLPRASASSSLN